MLMVILALDINGEARSQNRLDVPLSLQIIT